MKYLKIQQTGKSLRCFFFFNDTATTEIYTLSLHDALPILALVEKGLEAVLEFVDGHTAPPPGASGRECGPSNHCRVLQWGPTARRCKVRRRPEATSDQRSPT